MKSKRRRQKWQSLTCKSNQFYMIYSIWDINQFHWDTPFFKYKFPWPHLQWKKYPAINIIGKHDLRLYIKPSFYKLSASTRTLQQNHIQSLTSNQNMPFANSGDVWRAREGDRQSLTCKSNQFYMIYSIWDLN